MCIVLLLIYFSCNMVFCSRCHTPWHNNKDCPNYIKRMKKGHTLEKALMENPSVVDLLISLFYASVIQNTTLELASPDEVIVYDNNAIKQYNTPKLILSVIEKIPDINDLRVYNIILRNGLLEMFFKKN